MPKTKGAVRKPETHFERVPLEVVKQIAVEDPPTAQRLPAASQSVARPDKKTLITTVPTRAPAGKKR